MILHGRVVVLISIQRHHYTSKKINLKLNNKKAGTKKIPAKKQATKQLQDLNEDSLKDVYWAEKSLSKALQKDGKKRHFVKIQKEHRGPPYLYHIKPSLGKLGFGLLRAICH